MGNTINKVGKFVELSALDSDWTWTETFPGALNGIAIEYIAFLAIGDGDKLSIKEGSATGPHIYPPRCVKAQGPLDPLYVNGTCKPVLDYDKGTFSSGASVIIKLK